MSIRANYWLEKLGWWAWLALLVSVPFTSFPFVEATIGGDTVSPLSLLPLLLLTLVWLGPYMLKGRPLPAEVGPLLAFSFLALLSSAVGLLLPLEPYKGQMPLARTVRGVATLGIGVAFYVCAATISAEERKVRPSLQALYLGALLTLLWSSFQASYVLTGVENVPWNLNQIHRVFSIRDLFRDRVTGLAYEPSWFGDQLVVLYFPFWVGSLLANWSAFPRKGRMISVEFGMCLWGIGMLLLARSRISIAVLLVMLGGAFLYALWKASRGVAAWAGARSSPRIRSSLKWLFLALGVAVLAFTAVLLLRAGAEADWRMRRISRLSSEFPAIEREFPSEVTYELANRVAFAERVVYWRAGFVPFETHPALGVGLGNAGFVFEDAVPAYGYRLMEIRRALDPENLNFPNPKNLWIRLLAETGFVGFVAYATWLVVLAAASWALAKDGVRMTQAIGLAGLFGIGAHALEGFSLDSFALPQAWLLVGVLTAAIWRWRRSAAWVAVGGSDEATAMKPR